MTKVPEFGQEILAKKYYIDGETCPEDLFRRVAKVVSIPDVIDYFIEDEKLPENIAYLSEDPFGTLFYRGVGRRNLDISVGRFIRQEQFENVWKELQEKYYKAFCELDLVPASPVLMNAGNVGMLSSCFFIRIKDSMSDIFEVVKQVALISKKGGGVGLDFSDLRPKGSDVCGTKGTSSGPISFMKVFNTTGSTVEQGGRRRGALMATLRVDHPDILEFIDCKRKEGDLSNFNISVLISDTFMNAVKNKEKIDLWHPKAETKQIRAREIWEKLIKSAYRNGEPGIIFDDTVNKADVFSNKFGRLGCNPCSELNLLNYESCILAAINLSNHIINEKIDYEKLRENTKLGIRLLDNIVDLNEYPLFEVEKMSLMTRKIGLGSMGLHDMMLKMKIKYGSSESVDLIEDVYSTIKNTAEEYSEHLGTVRGIPEELSKLGIKRRNSGLLTVQPTGTVSCIAGCSSGIEPVFQWEYARKDSYGEHTIKHFILDLPEKRIPNYAVTAMQITPEEHLLIQSEVQKYIDSSISKTLNLPNNASIADVTSIYKNAYAFGCKSVTVYRSGSREEEVLQLKEDSKEKIIKEPEPKPIRIRPKILFGATLKLNTPEGPLYITINEDEYGIREALLSISKAGSSVSTYNASLGRLISNNLQYHAPVESIIQHLIDQKSSPIFSEGETIKSVPDAVAKALKLYRDNIEGFSEYLPSDISSVNADDIHDKYSGDMCPECGENMRMEGGCCLCSNCGYSKCG